MKITSYTLCTWEHLPYMAGLKKWPLTCCGWQVTLHFSPCYPTCQQVQVSGQLDNLPTVAGQRSLFGLGGFFVSNLLTSAGLWSLFCLWFIRQHFCFNNLPTVAGQRPVFGPLTITCQPQQVNRHFSEMRRRMSATCLPPQVYGHFSDIE